MLGDNLRKLRKLRGIKVPVIASRLHIIPDTYYKWERNERDIPTSKLRPLAEIFNVSVDFLLKNEQETTKNDLLHNLVSFAEKPNNTKYMLIVDYLSKKWEGDFPAVILLAGIYGSLPPEIRKDISSLALFDFEQSFEECDTTLRNLIDTNYYQLCLDELYNKADTN